MPNTLTIKVEFELPEDFDELRVKAVDAVESLVEEYKAEGDNVGDIDVSWDVDTDPKDTE